MDVFWFVCVVYTNAAGLFVDLYKDARVNNSTNLSRVDSLPRLLFFTHYEYTCLVRVVTVKPFWIHVLGVLFQSICVI